MDFNLKTIILFSALILVQTGVWAQLYKTGLLREDSAYYSLPGKPANMKWSDIISGKPVASLKQFVPLVFSQGKHKTCAGWATTYYARTILDNIPSPSHSECYSPLWTYVHSKEAGKDCDAGAYLSKALSTLRDLGVPYKNSFDYLCVDSIPFSLYPSAAQNKIWGFIRLFNANDSAQIKIENIKNSLANNFPVVVAFDAHEDFVNTTTNLYTPIQNSKSNGGHALCLIGYNDTMYGGAFEVVNSWGTKWGDNGFCWVKYEDLITYAFYAYELIGYSQSKLAVAGSIDLFLNDGTKLIVKEAIDSSQKHFDYCTDKKLSNGTKYRIAININEPINMYIIAADDRNFVGKLFPHKPNVSSLINYVGSQILLPDGNSWIRIGGNSTVEYLAIIFSIEALDIDTLISSLKGHTGDNFKSKLYSTLGIESTLSEVGILEGNDIKFKLKLKKKPFALVLGIKKE